jgi:hypothetical protein
MRMSKDGEEQGEGSKGVCLKTAQKGAVVGEDGGGGKRGGVVKKPGERKKVKKLREILSSRSLSTIRNHEDEMDLVAGSAVMKVCFTWSEAFGYRK